MNIPILIEDDQLIVIDKPAGVTVNRADTVGEETIQDWIEQRKKVKGKRQKAKHPIFSSFFLLPSSFASRSGIVHRLDKETSGCLIIAKTPEVFAELQRQFKAREVKKEYLALVHDRVGPKQGSIKVPLARSRFDRQKFTVSAGGRMSETSYKILQTFEGPTLSTQGRTLSKFTLLRLFPKTGRTHQIRVHLKYFGHPIVADDKYAGEDRAREDRKWCPRMFLHAAKISFTHPVTKKTMTIEASLPADLEKVRQEL